MLELLLPAGSPDAVTAAVQNGADAVYISFSDLNGCRGTVNFSPLDSAFENAVRYCRIRGCRVVLAMNCLLRDDELPAAAGHAVRAQRAGVDAILLRDAGLAAILKKLLPEMPLYADETMGYGTEEGLKAAEKAGFTRVFLPAELSAEEMCRLAANSPVELGAVVQSAMTAAAAGTDRMSSLNGRGSETRGYPSTTAREPYRFGGRWDKTPLSFLDRCLLPDIDRLREAGLACAMVGGQEKRPEYTALMAKIYGNAIREDRYPADLDLERAEYAFSDFGYAREAVYEPAGEPLEREKDYDKFCAEIRRDYVKNEMRRVDVAFAAALRNERSALVLGAQDKDGHTVTQEGPRPLAEGSFKLTEVNLEESMYRTSGTPYRCAEVKTAIPAGLFMDSAELDAARRKLLYKLSEARGKVEARKEGTFPALPSTRLTPVLPVFTFRFQNASQMTRELAAYAPAAVYVPAELLLDRPELADPYEENGAEIVAELPDIYAGLAEREALKAMIEDLKAIGVETVLAGSPGTAQLAKEAGMKLRGNLGLAPMNGYSLQAMADGEFLSAVVSPELSLKQISLLPKPLNTELFAYGRLPAMVSQPCLLKASAGRCTCSVPGHMSDAHGGVWPVTRCFGCRNTVWDARKIWLGDRVEAWIKTGIWAARLSFSSESPRECLEVANAYMNGSGYRPNGMTRGAYERGTA